MTDALKKEKQPTNQPNNTPNPALTKRTNKNQKKPQQNKKAHTRIINTNETVELWVDASRDKYYLTRKPRSSMSP